MIKQLGNPNLIDSLSDLIYYLFMKKYFKFIQKWHLLIFLVVLVTMITKPITSAYSEENGAVCLASDSMLLTAETPEALALDVESIVASVLKKPWSVPATCKPAVLNSNSTSFVDEAKICAFYSCANKSVELAGICRAADPNAYFMNYGKKYCDRFSKKTSTNLSADGKIWLNKTLVCLQKAIIKFCTNGNNCDQCDKIRTQAYASHAPCYTNSGLCYLNPIDLVYISSTPDIVKDVLNYDGIVQIGQVAGLCGGKIAKDAVKEICSTTKSCVNTAIGWSSKMIKVTTMPLVGVLDILF